MLQSVVCGWVCEGLLGDKAALGGGGYKRYNAYYGNSILGTLVGARGRSRPVRYKEILDINLASPLPTILKRPLCQFGVTECDLLLAE